MTSDAVGGVWTHALDLARGLSPHGVEVILATMGPAPSPEQRAEAESVSGLRLETSTYALEWMEAPWEDVERAGEWLQDLASRTSPDVIHLNAFAHARLPFEAPTLVGAHSCVSGWWDAVHGGPPGPEWHRYRAEVSAGLAAADMVIAPTRFMFDTLARHYDARPSSARVIPNGRDASCFRTEAKRQTVIAVGRYWDEAKQIATLDEAAAGISWPLRVAGDTTSPEGRAAEAPKHARLLGRLDCSALVDEYARAAIYANAAVYEPFGLGALEAALSGCALVLSDIASLREVWGDAAAFATPRDPASFRDAIQTLIDDPELRRDMAARAGARATSYSIHAMARGYLDAYAALSQDKKEVRSCAS